MKTLTEYNQKALAFLAKYGIDFTVIRAKNNACPAWGGEDKKTNRNGCPQCGSIHGNKYNVRLSRALTGKRIGFAFWNSLCDSLIDEPPSAYDVLSSVSADIVCPETFEDFCAEYGYEQDSRKAFSTFRRCAVHSAKLRGFFDDEAMKSELAEIN